MKTKRTQRPEHKERWENRDVKLGENRGHVQGSGQNKIVERPERAGMQELLARFQAGSPRR